MLQEHLGYLADAPRLDKFRRAIAAVVRPGDVVADLGCGSGILGLLALQAGAAHVYAIDDSAMLHVARETLARAGLAQRATFIQGRSQQVSLPARVDVAMCDHVGYFGFDYGIVELLADARRRFLKPGGAIVPARIALQLAAVESAAARRYTEDWRAERVPAEFHWLREKAVNAKHDIGLRPEDVLSSPVSPGTLELGADVPPYLSWQGELPIARDGLVHGLAGWFDCELAAGVGMSNSPLASDRIDRSQAFLPIDEPVPVKRGEALKATLMLRPADIVIGWVVESPAGDRRYGHSTWQGMPLAPEDLQRAHPERVPVPGSEALARGIVLGYCDGRRTVREIGAAVAREHPQLLPSAAELERFVAQVLAGDTR